MTSTVADHRVRVRPEFAVIPLDDDSVLVRAPHEGMRVKVDGISAPALAALLTGTDDGLAAADGSSATSDAAPFDGDRAEHIEALVTGLARRDVLERPNAVAATTPGERFFAQFHDDFGGCARRLAASRVVVAGGGALATTLGDDLRRAGIGDVERFTPGTSPARGDVLAACRDAHLVVVCPPSAGRSILETVMNSVALEVGVPWLPVRIFGGEAFVGPLFLASEGPCHACVTTREEATWADPELTRAYLAWTTEHPSSVEAYGALPAFDAIASQWAALEATRYLSRFTAPLLAGYVLHVDFVRCRMQLHRVLRVPRCPQCSPLARRPAVDAIFHARGR